jgi:hypothetical protein
LTFTGIQNVTFQKLEISVDSIVEMLYIIQIKLYLPIFILKDSGGRTALIFREHDAAECVWTHDRGRSRRVEIISEWRAS